jgi:hypothetical protein
VSDIFREVNEDLRRDEAAKVWKKYGVYVVGLAAAIVLATLGYQLWQKWDSDRRMERSDHFVEAARLAAGQDAEAAVPALAELGPPDGAYGSLATFERARVLAEAGRRDEAIALWDELAADGGAGSALQSAARLFAVMHQVDDGEPSGLRSRLEPLLVPGNGFRATALELTAILALREGDRDEARRVYTELADDLTAPPGLRTRAAQMLAALKD